MAQISIYLDEETLQKVKEAADLNQVSVSRWIRQQLTKNLEKEWPEGYFDLFGSLAGEEFERPSQIPFTEDIERETM